MENIEKIKNKKTVIILSVIIVVTLLFIWLHSCMDMETSSEESGFFYKLLCPFFEIFMGKGNVTELFIRKLAHFTEFLGLGLELMLYMHLLINEKKIILVISAWVIGTFCAIIDESIQLLSGRGSQIADVWLDSFGCITGVLIMLGIYIIYKKRHLAKS